MTHPEPAPGPSASLRGVAVVGAAIVVLLVAVVTIVLLAADREVDLEPGSPEAALADYLAAFDADDLAAVHAHFSSEVRGRWDLEAYRRAVDLYGFDRTPGAARRVLFDRADITGDTARVRLTVEEFIGEGLSGDTYRSTRDIRMVREDGSWRIDEPLVWLDPVPATLP